MLRNALVLGLSLASLPASAGALATPVVGGTPVPAGAWPDVVAIVGEDGLCTGTLVAADLVITAGHCIEARPKEVIIGAVDLAAPDGERRRVKWSRAYPSWIDRYDVGVVMLENPVFVKQRAVAQGCTARERLVPGALLQVVGFGLTTKSGDGDNTRMHQAAIPVIDATCTTEPSCAPAVAPGGEFVAGGHGTDSCFGDSGGPVYIDTAEGPALIGIVSRGVASWNEPCGDGGVYVRADKVVSWIQSVTGRKLDRIPCDGPADGEDVIEPAGCTAGGGLLESGFAIAYGALCIFGMRRRRRQARSSAK